VLDAAVIGRRDGKEFGFAQRFAPGWANGSQIPAMKSFMLWIALDLGGDRCLRCAAVVVCCLA
jgi:hypothetical protein